MRNLGNIDEEKDLITKEYVDVLGDKLENIEEGANNYSLPIASSTSLGGIKSGTDITVDASGNVSVNEDSHTHSYNTISSVDSLNVKQISGGCTSGTLGVIDIAKIDVAGACRTAFMPADAIIVEYSLDNGVTFLDYGLTDSEKMGLFSMNRGKTIYLGKGANQSLDNQVRITVKPIDRYTSADQFYCWFSTSGATCTVDVESSTIGDKEVFVTRYSDIKVSGWSGNNLLNLSGSTFGGGSSQTSNTYAYRFTFKTKTISSTYTSAPSVTDLRIYGKNAWSTPNSMMENNNMYSWDTDKNVTFPAQLKAEEVYDNSQRVYSPSNKPTKTDVGLSNVDNTSDVNKPVSTAQQTALNAKANTSQVLTDVPVNAVFTDSAVLVANGLGYALDNGSSRCVLGTDAVDLSYAIFPMTGAIGDYSHAEGYVTTASGDYSHAEGNNTKAFGGKSHAEGHSTNATGEMSHAEGYGTTASGAFSHAEGISTTASGVRSHAQNGYTTARGYQQTAIGTYNIAQGTTTSKVASDFAFIIGNGTADNERANALTVDWAGNVNIPTGAEYRIDGTSLIPENALFTDTVYTHPSTSGNKHIPSGGSADQILQYDSDGTAKWADAPETGYTEEECLSDATCTALDIATTSVPDDALAKLAENIVVVNRYYPTTWTSATLPVSAGWHGVTYGDGKFVAIAYGTSAAYSTDGINWISAILPASLAWWSVTYGGGKFMAVASSSASAAYSTDGINWTSATLPVSAKWRSVTYGDGKFVAVAYDSTVAAYSTDGINWTSATLPVSKSWHGVAYGNGKFVVVGYNSESVAYSTDGINWILATLPVTAYWYSVTYGDGKFVAIASGSTNAAYSTDGINWTPATLPASPSWRSVTYGDGKFVVVTYNSTSAAYSIDGITWTSAILPKWGIWETVTYGDGKFVSVSYDSANAAYVEGITSISHASGWGGSVDQVLTYDSDGTAKWTDAPETGYTKTECLSDATCTALDIPTTSVPDDALAKLAENIVVVNRYYPTTWTSATLPVSASWYSVTSGDGKFVAVSYNSTSAAYSTDGITWTSATLPVSQSWSSVTYGNGMFVAIASNSSFAVYSTDGINWTSATLPVTAYWCSVTYGDGKFVAVTQYSTSAAYSTDGINWTSATLPAAKTWVSVTYGDGKFVAVASSSSFAAYSTDGINWTSATLPVSANWYSVTSGDGKFVAVAMNSTSAAYSTDGINWTSATLPVSASWYSVTSGDGKFVAVSYNSTSAAYSIDGITWTSATLPVYTTWQSVTYGDGKFVAVARGSTNAAYVEGITHISHASGWGGSEGQVLTYDSDGTAVWTDAPETGYSKEECLSDATCTALGLPTTSVPDDALVKLKTFTAANTTSIDDIITNKLKYARRLLRPSHFAIKVNAGRFNMSWDGDSNRLWVFPSGTVEYANGTTAIYTSSDAQPDVTIAEDDSVVHLICSNWQGAYSLNHQSVKATLICDLADLPPLSYYLSLSSCTNITGDLADLPPLSYALSLPMCTNITGDLADLPPLSYALDLYNCTNITGDLADLPPLSYYLGLYNCTNITGDLADLQPLSYCLNLSNCSNVTGIYSQVNGSNVPTATDICYTGLSATDMDNTLIAYAACTKDDGTFSADGMTRTTASDTAVSALTGRGWTISGITKV